MKKIFLILVFISSIFNTFIYSQNDSYIDIGNLRIRYDRDSNYVRFGIRPLSLGLGNFRLAKELDGQLFKFNSSQFSWSTSTGLNLSNPVNHDSSWSRIFTVTKDTGDGELIPIQKRAYSLKKLFWANDIDIWSNLKLYYYSWNSSGSLAAIDSTRLVNDAGQKINRENVGLSNTWADKDTITLTCGKWLINCNAEYEFIDAITAGTVQDSIMCRLFDGSKAVEGSEQSVSLTYPSGVTTGMRGIMCFNIVISLPVATKTYYLQMRTETATSSIHFGNRDNISYTLVR
jgi:hypothetical protein